MQCLIVFVIIMVSTQPFTGVEKYVFKTIDTIIYYHFVLFPSLVFVFAQ